MLFTFNGLLPAQKIDSLLSAEAGADAVSSYVWRGIRYVPSPAIQPSMAVSLGNITIGAWSSWHFFSGWSEIDLSATYENEYLSIGVTDYYTASNYLLDNYFNYRPGAGGHIIEMNAGYPGSEKIPFKLLIATNILGDLDANDHENYSTFIELAWLFGIGHFDGQLRGAITPAPGMYADKAAPAVFTFRLDREIAFPQDFSMKMFSELSVNPNTQGVYLVAGLGLNF